MHYGILLKNREIARISNPLIKHLIPLFSVSLNPKLLYAFRCFHYHHYHANPGEPVLPCKQDPEGPKPRKGPKHACKNRKLVIMASLASPSANGEGDMGISLLLSGG